MPCGSGAENEPGSFPNSRSGVVKSTHTVAEGRVRVVVAIFRVGMMRATDGGIDSIPPLFVMVLPQVDLHRYRSLQRVRLSVFGKEKPLSLEAAFA